MSEFPSFSDQAQNLTKLIQDVIMDAVKGNQIFASDEVQNQRMDICKECEHYHEEQVRCKECGCFLEDKTSYSAAICPVRKW
jgi:formamidopyrimidine-DNA glycosylase